MCCETHNSFRRGIFKPTESNFRAQVKFVADGHRDTAVMKIRRKIFIVLVAGSPALNSVPSAPVFCTIPRQPTLHRRPVR
jgi:hypothetical protein